jgi:hypothetical protein
MMEIVIDVDAPRTGWVRPGIITFWTQLVALAACLIGSLGIVTLAVMRTGDAGGFLDPQLTRLDDPKISFPPFAPLAWLVDLCRVAAWSVVPLAALTLLAGLVALIRTRRAGDRAMFLRVAVVTAAWILVVAVALSPYGRQLNTWLLD